MAQILDSFTFGRNPGTRQGKYNWDELFDGQIRQLSADEIGTKKLSYWVFAARKRAKARGLNLMTQVINGGEALVLQALPREQTVEANGEAPKAEAEVEAETPATLKRKGKK